MAAKRPGLGRGIGALIPTGQSENAPGERAVDVFFPNQQGGDVEYAPEQDLVAVPGARLAYLNPANIVPNAQQPRHVFDPEDLAELVHSIREVGVLQPIVVRPIPGSSTQFELIMGVSADCAPAKRLAWRVSRQSSKTPPMRTCFGMPCSRTCTALN